MGFYPCAITAFGRFLLPRKTQRRDIRQDWTCSMADQPDHSSIMNCLKIQGAKLREQEKIIDRLRNDPAYVEKVIRRRLNYAKPDEFLFRFED